MGKQKEGSAPATWKMETTLIYCDMCIKEIELGNRPTTHFNKEGWRNLTKNFNKHTGRSYKCTQLKNKWDQLMKEWTLWKDLLRGETGIGWNPLEKTIDASNEWWTEKLQVLPSAKKFRYNGIMPELEEKLDIMFGRIVAMGNDVWIPNSGILPPEFRDVEEDAFEEEHQGDDANTLHGHVYDNHSRTDSQRSHNTHPVIHKRKRIKTTNSGERQRFIDLVKELVNAARSISSAISIANASQKSVTIQDALEEISHIPEIFDDLDFYDFAIDYFRDKNHRETFMGVPADRKVWWLRRRYQRSFSSLL